MRPARLAISAVSSLPALLVAQAPRADVLPVQTRVDGAEALILAATRDSWVVAIRDMTTGYHCLMSIGPDGLPGIVDGVMRCGW